MRIGTIETSKGRKQHGHIDMPDYAGTVRVRFPLITLTGKKERPLVVLLAAQHGRELNGVEVIRQFFQKTSPEELNGTVATVPVVNPLAVPALQQDYPTELGRYLGKATTGGQYNMNRNWPGAWQGQLAECMCATLMHEVIKNADVVIDLHGWTDNSLGLAWSLEEHRDLLDAFGMLTSMIQTREEVEKLNGRLQKACMEKDIPSLTAELPPQHRINQATVACGLRGVKNVCKQLDVLPGDVELPDERYYINSETREHLFVAEYSGFLYPEVPLGTFLREGERAGIIYSMMTLEPLQELIAPFDGFLFNAGIEFCESMPPTNYVTPKQTVAIIKENAE